MTDRDETLDEFTRHMLRELDPPPPTPRDEIWARIEATRAARAAEAAPGVERLRPRRSARLHWAVGLAATLVVGIGLGRLSVRQATSPDAPPIASVDAPADAADADQVPVAYQVATSEHLQRTEALFASLAIDVRTRGPEEVTGWARELLTDTRLLLGSPAAADPETGRLLEELELVLSQIAAIPAARADEEVELIQDAINQSDVLLRMRAATAGRRLVGT